MFSCTSLQWIGLYRTQNCLSLDCVIAIEENFKVQSLVLLVGKWMNRGPAWCGISTRGTLSLGKRGKMIQACECIAPKTQPSQVSSTKLPFYHGTPNPLLILHADEDPFPASPYPTIVLAW